MKQVNSHSLTSWSLSSKAIVFSACLHLLVFFIFDIQMHPKETDIILSPVQAHAHFDDNMMQQSLSHVIQQDPLGFLPNYLNAPKGSRPQETLLPAVSMKKKIDYKKKYRPIHNQFQLLEDRHYPQHLYSFTFNKKYRPLNIKISGDLGSKVLKKNAILEKGEIAYRVGPTQTIPFVFQVQVEEKTGKIFWFSKLSPQRLLLDDPLNLQQKAHRILKSLHFQEKHSSKNIISGRVEVLFEVEITPDSQLSELDTFSDENEISYD